MRPSFFRIGRDGLTAEMQRSGRAWKKLVAHHARTGSIPIMTTEGAVKAEVFRRMNEES